MGAGLGWISAAWKGNDGSRNGGKRQKNITHQPFWGDILVIKWDTEPFESHLGLSSNGEMQNKIKVVTKTMGK